MSAERIETPGGTLRREARQRELDRTLAWVPGIDDGAERREAERIDAARREAERREAASDETTGEARSWAYADDESRDALGW